MLPIGSVDISSLIGNAENLSSVKNAASLDPDTLNQALGAASSAAASSAASAGASSAASSAASAVTGAQSPSFSSVLQNAVQEVNAKMSDADVAKTKLLTGETGNVHQAMIAVQESNVAFSLMVEVRNKLVDSYQELMRMQV